MDVSEKTWIAAVKPYLGAGASENQIEFLLEKSQHGGLWLKLIAPHMRAPLPAEDALTLVKWIAGREVTPTEDNRPLPLTPRSEWEKWVSIVLDTLGLLHWTWEDIARWDYWAGEVVEPAFYPESAPEPQLQLAVRGVSLSQRLPQNLEEWEEMLKARYAIPNPKWPNRRSWTWDFEDDAQKGRGETDPEKVKNPLVAAWMGGGATETQIEHLLWHSMRYEGWLMLIASRMRTNLSCKEAAALCEWIDEGNHNEWDSPLPVRPKSDWWDWIFAVRKAAGLPEFTADEKVKNRFTRITGWIQEEPVPLAIPLEKGERLYVWLLSILLSLGWILFWGAIGSVLLGLIFLGAFILLGLAYFGIRGILDLFKR